MFKKALLALMILAGAVGPSLAQSSGSRVVIGNETIPGPASPGCTVGPCFVPHVGISTLGYQQFTVVASTALPSIPASAKEAFIVCEGQTVRWRDDGVAPTTTVGMPLPVNTAFPYTGALSALRIIQTASAATCNVTYYP